jgi:hypothetical protein
MQYPVHGFACEIRHMDARSLALQSQKRRKASELLRSIEFISNTFSLNNVSDVNRHAMFAGSLNTVLLGATISFFCESCHLATYEYQFRFWNWFRHRVPRSMSTGII